MVANHETEVVRQQTMKTDMLEAQFTMSALELCLPVGTQRHGRVIAADGVFPEVRERRSCFCQITEETEAAHPCLPLLSSQNLTHGAATKFRRHTVNEMRRECVDVS